ncbi:MAG: M20/M25/M40 family metallo-hydrolase [Acidobacteriota bacterium]
MKPLVPLFVLALLAAPAAVETASKAESRVTEASVLGHLEFLAGDALNGRGSGTRDEWIAATYIAAQLRRSGIEPLGDDGGYVQDVRIERSEVTAPPVLSVGDRTLTDGKEMVVSRLSAARVSGPLQKYRAGVPVIAGAALLLPDRLPFPTGAETVAAAMVISIETEAARTRRLASPARVLSIQHLAGVAGGAVIALDASSHAALASLPDGAPIQLDADAKPPVVAHTWNALGRLTGRTQTRADQVILLTAHLDHLGNRAPATPPEPGADTIFNGADDDASGSVAVLELAEALARGRRPRRTTVFAWFGSEESGGAGAAHFIDAPPVPLDHIVANLEFEMIGRGDRAVAPHTLWLTGYERSTLGPALAKHGARIVADPHPGQNFFMRSDNIQLARRGVIAQTVSSFGLHTDYHRPSDEVKTIDLAHMTEAIRSMVEPVLWLANAGFRPEWSAGMKP